MSRLSPRHQGLVDDITMQLEQAVQAGESALQSLVFLELDDDLDDDEENLKGLRENLESAVHNLNDAQKDLSDFLQNLEN